MDPLLRTTVLKLATPAAGVAVLLAVTRLRGVSWCDDVGFRRPAASRALGWLGLWVAWMLASEALIRAFGLDQAAVWPDYAPPILVMRILAIGVLGPILEEMVMRGLLFHFLRRTAVGALGAIVIISLVWTAIHYRYGPGTLALVFADGLLFGLARHQGHSLWLPIGMHMLGNLISIVQSLM